jgi:RHS repeat-associated protein
MPLSSTGTSVGPFGFAGGYGYQEDGDSGLKLLGHRYYDPSAGGFLTRDRAQDGRNWYAYCGGGPTREADPSGLMAEEAACAVEIATDLADPCIVDGVTGSAALAATDVAAGDPVGNEGLPYLGDKTQEIIDWFKQVFGIDVEPLVAKVAPSASKMQASVAEAEERHPNAVGEQGYHIIPKYVGGPADGPVSRIPTAYHQVVTQAFRTAWGYGQGTKPSGQQLRNIFVEVHSKLPLL